jgi:hypothetical protein
MNRGKHSTNRDVLNGQLYITIQKVKVGCLLHPKELTRVSQVLMVLRFTSFPAATFWHELITKTLDIYKLDDSPLASQRPLDIG